jgi:hypothetical protein
MVLAEGPICCIGTVALLILILGVVLMITGTGSSEGDEDDYVYEPYEQDYEPNSEVEGWSTYTDQPIGVADPQ